MEKHNDFVYKTIKNTESYALEMKVYNNIYYNDVYNHKTTFSIEKRSDYVYLSGLMLYTKTNDYDLDNLKYYDVGLEINNCKIMSHKLDVLAKFGSVYNEDNKILVSLPHRYWFGEIPLVNTDIVITIKCNRKTDIENIELLCDHKYISQSNRETMSKNHTFYIGDITTTYEHYNQNYKTIKYLFPYNAKRFTRGVFLECDVYNIEHFTYVLCETEVMNMSGTVVRYIGNIINDNLIYIPFDNNKSYKQIGNSVNKPHIYSSPLLLDCDRTKYEITECVIIKLKNQVESFNIYVYGEYKIYMDLLSQKIEYDNEYYYQ